MTSAKGMRDVFFEGLGQSLSCFEDRIKDSYNFIVDRMEKAELAKDNKRADGNIDDNLPAGLNVTRGTKNEVLSAYYLKYTTTPSFVDDLNGFTDFLKTTHCADLNTSEGRIEPSNITQFWQFISMSEQS